MENNFDEYIKGKMDSIGNEPLSKDLWDKTKTWGKIAAGLKPEPKTISQNWLYAAACILLLLCSGAFFSYQKYSGILSQIRNENERLQHQLASQSQIKQALVAKRVFTLFKNKEIVKTVYQQNTVYVHDTIKSIVYIKDPIQQDKTFAINTQILKDSSLKVLVIPKKVNKLHFILGSAPSEDDDVEKYQFVSTNKLLKTGPQPAQPNATLVFELN